MILKVLLVIAVIAIVYFLFFKNSRKESSRSHTSSRDETKSEEMVACHTCGTYSSVSDSILKGGHYYCSSDCLKG
jgi:ribosomal protein L32